MLKYISPMERREQAVNALGKFSIPVGAVLMGWIIWLKGDLPGPWLFALIMAVTVAVGAAAVVLWYALVLWLGRLDPEEAALNSEDPRKGQAFLESFWDNEIVLQVFVFMFRTVVSVWLVSVLGTRFGLL